MKRARVSATAGALLALALLCFSAPAAAARAPGRRQLRGQVPQQPAAPSAAAAAAPPAVASPLSERPLNATPPAGLTECEALVESLQNDCTVSIDRIAMMGYGRGADGPPTARQAATVLAALQSAGLPPRKCCVTAAAFSASDCVCNPEMDPHLHNWLNEQAGVEFEFVQGALAILDMAETCSNPVPPCLAIVGVHAQDGTR